MSSTALDEQVEATPPPLGTPIPSPLLQALHGRSIRVNEPPDRGHFLTAYALLHLRLARSIDSAIISLNEEEERRKQEGYKGETSGNPDIALDAFQNSIYRAAELFEFYEKHLLDYLRVHGFGKNFQHRPKYMEAIKEAKRTWGLLCNRCKHNHDFLVPVEGLYETGEWVNGFSLFRRAGNEIAVNPDIHKSAEAFSYNWCLRALLSDVVRADVAAATLVSKLQDDVKQPVLDTFGAASLPYLNAFIAASQRPTTAMPRESKLTEESISFAGNQIRIGWEEVPNTENKQCRMTVFMSLLGTGLAVRLPYDKIVRTFEIATPVPLGFMFRVVYNDVVVPAEG